MLDYVVLNEESLLPINFNSIPNNLSPPSGRNNFSAQLCPDQNVAQIKFDAVSNLARQGAVRFAVRI